MKEHSVVQFRRPEQIHDALKVLLHEGAQGLIAQAVQIELEEFLAGFSGQRDEFGRATVVRNGYQPARSILTGIGPVGVRLPKVRSRGEEAAAGNRVRLEFPEQAAGGGAFRAPFRAAATWAPAKGRPHGKSSLTLFSL